MNSNIWNGRNITEGNRKAVRTESWHSHQNGATHTNEAHFRVVSTHRGWTVERKEGTITQ